MEITGRLYYYGVKKLGRIQMDVFVKFLTLLFIPYRIFINSGPMWFKNK